MTCPNCGGESSRVIIRKSGSYCHNCAGINETGGTQLGGILTRNSSRIRSQQDHHAGDTVQPHKYDAASGKVIPNPDFIKLYPDQTGNYYTEQEVIASGNKRLVKQWQKQSSELAAADAARREVAAPKPTKAEKKQTAKFIGKL